MDPRVPTKPVSGGPRTQFCVVVVVVVVVAVVVVLAGKGETLALAVPNRLGLPFQRGILDGTHLGSLLRSENPG